MSMLDDKYDDLEKNLRKIFVGNVPFQCTREEFIDCFKNLEGFVTADIIRRYRSKLSRGFGFVVFSDKPSADKLLNGSAVMLKDRVLRFSVYDTSIKTEMSDDTYMSSPEKPISDIKNVVIPSIKESPMPPGISNIYQIYLNNLDNDISTGVLLKLLKSYGDIESCKVSQTVEKDFEKYAILTVNSYLTYNNILEANNESFDAYPYIVKPKKSKAMNSRVAYREGFNAGQMVGYRQGMIETLKKLKERSDKN